MSSRAPERVLRLHLVALVVLAVLGGAAIAPGSGRAAERLALMVKPLDQPEECWWETGGRGRVGPLHTTLSTALGELGLFVVGPVDPVELAAEPQDGRLGDEAALALARRAGASSALVGELRARFLEPPKLLGLHGVEVQLEVRLASATLAGARDVRITGRAFESDPAAARRQAIAPAARRFASWVRARLPQPQAIPAAEEGEVALRVRGLRQLAELRQIVQRIQEKQAATLWIASATPGEAQLAGKGSGRGLVPLITALESAPFAGFALRVSVEQGVLVVDVEPLAQPEPSAVPPPGAAPAVPGIMPRLPEP